MVLKWPFSGVVTSAGVVALVATGVLPTGRGNIGCFRVAHAGPVSPCVWEQGSFANLPDKYYHPRGWNTTISPPNVTTRLDETPPRRQKAPRRGRVFDATLRSPDIQVTRLVLVQGLRRDRRPRGCLPDFPRWVNSRGKRFSAEHDNQRKSK